jgi:hypothetical protein
MREKIWFILILIIILLTGCDKSGDVPKTLKPLTPTPSLSQDGVTEDNQTYQATIYPLPTLTTEEYEDRFWEMSEYAIALIEYNHYGDAMNFLVKMGDEIVPAELWNFVCWNGAIDGYSEEVLQACEKAVLLDPEMGAYRDSRGLVRALLGDINGAIEDFGFFIVWYETVSLEELEAQGYSEEMVIRRKKWIQDLRDDINPFTDKEIARLQVEENTSYLEEDDINIFEHVSFLIFATPGLIEYQHYDDANDAATRLANALDNEDIGAFMKYYICVKGSVKGDAETVMPYCDLAVEQVSLEGIYLDGRGIARAITGDVDGAISDFNKYIEVTEEMEFLELDIYYHNMSIDHEIIEIWIESLQNGEYPFTSNDFLGLYEMPFVMDLTEYW